MGLISFGWDKYFEEKYQDFKKKGFLPARVIETNRLVYTLFSEKGEISGKLSGTFRFNCQSKGEYPTVGDWITFKPNQHKGFVSITGMLDRKSRFSRKMTGKVSDEQVIAANIDTIFIVSGLDQDFNIRRLERYVVLAAESNAKYIFILNKTDLCNNVEEITSELSALFPNIPILSLSAIEKKGINQLESYIPKGKTIVFLGSSGVGKSTIINSLIGEEKQKTGHISDYDGKGRHITTSKNIILLPSGGLVIDTPGLRELQLFSSGEGLKTAFSDIEETSKKCKYKNCSHTNEPGCAVLKSIQEGEISEKRLVNYHKLTREIQHNLTKSNERYKNKKNEFWMMVTKKRKQLKKK